MAFDPIAFVRTHGIVLASAKGPIPNVADAIAGEPIRGSWWAHPRGHAIFAALGKIDDHPDVLAFRLVAKKVTFVHRRLWPALVRLATELGRANLAAVTQEHTASGAHRSVRVAFPRWVPDEVVEAANTLTAEQARALLGAAITRVATSRAAPSSETTRRRRAHRDAQSTRSRRSRA